MAAMTLRLDDDLMADLTVVAQCDGETLTDAIRAAVTAWVQLRRDDPLFQEALQRHIKQAKRLSSSV